MIRGVVMVATLLASLTSTARADMVHAAAPAAASTAQEGVVNLNAASEDQLGYLPGIGPSKAKAIVEHRRTHPFHRVDELTKVKGIGKKTFGRLRPYLTVAGPTTLQQEVKMHR